MEIHKNPFTARSDSSAGFHCGKCLLPAMRHCRMDGAAQANSLRGSSVTGRA